MPHAGGPMFRNSLHYKELSPNLPRRRSLGASRRDREGQRNRNGPGHWLFLARGKDGIITLPNVAGRVLRLTFYQPEREKAHVLK